MKLEDQKVVLGDSEDLTALGIFKSNYSFTKTDQIKPTMKEH